MISCDAQLATLSHVMLTCPVSQAVWHWLASLWTAISQQEQPPLHTDLLLADDRRGPWQPPAELNSLWHRLRLLVIAQLWTAYCTARAQPEQHMTARCAKTGCWWAQISGLGQGCSATGSGGDSQGSVQSSSSSAGATQTSFAACQRKSTSPCSYTGPQHTQSRYHTDNLPWPTTAVNWYSMTILLWCPSGTAPSPSCLSMIAVEAVGACVCLQHRSISHYHRTQVVQSPFAVSMYSTCLLQTSAASGIQTPSASTHSHRSTPHLVELEMRPCCEAYCCHALLNPGPVQSVEGLLGVEKDKDTRLLGLLAVVYLLQRTLHSSSEQDISHDSSG